MNILRPFFKSLILFAAITCSLLQRSLAQVVYAVDTIPYQPYAYTGGNPVLVRLDDLYSQSVAIGFNFSFYGQTYSNLVVGSNGNLSFDSSYAGMNDPWQLPPATTIPNPTLPLNSIFGAYRDIDNTNIGAVTYQLLGTAPNRIFLVSYDSIPLFGSAHSTSPFTAQDSSLSTFEVALYEGCNSIEVYIHHSPSDTLWNNGLGLIGIQNSGGTSAVAVSGHNNTRWTADNQAWRFSIVGSSTCARSSAGADQALCINHVATMQATGTGTWSASGANPATIVITNPSSPNTTVSGFSTPGSYMLIWTTLVDTSAITVTVSSCSDSVWPGDADFNGLVNNDDLLPIGLAYDSTGPARAVQGLVWQAAAATNWTNSLNAYVPAVNYKHADCNGDGIVDTGDVWAINQNYSQLHYKTGGPTPARNGVPTIYAVASADTLHTGDNLTVNFKLADSTLTMSNFYGLAFTYHYDAALVDSAYTSMAYNNSWIGNADKISLVKILHGTGEIQTAVTRIDHSARSGYGVIGSANFKVRSDLTAQALSHILNTGYISDVHAVDVTGSPVTLNAGADSTVVIVSPLGISEHATSKVYLQPNPARDRVLIAADQSISEISITDMMGKEVMNTKPAGGSSATIELSAYSSGVYFVSVKTTTGTGIAKLVVER